MFYAASAAASRALYNLVMPTCAELAKRLEVLENVLQGKLSAVVEDVVSRAISRMDALPNQSIEKLKKEIDEFKISVNFLNETVEKLKADQKHLLAENKTLSARNSELEKRIAEMEQYSRKNNIEIKGVPCTQGESCRAILQSIGNKIQCPLSDSDVDIVHRVPSSSNTKHLIARFCSRSKKAEFISKARKARLQTSDLGFSGNDARPVYINDHLTQQNKKIFAMALNLKKERKWQFLWTDDCQIKARKTTDSRVFRIRDEADLSVFSN